MLLVTGGAGFIGSNFVTSMLAEAGEPIVNLDLIVGMHRDVDHQVAMAHFGANKGSVADDTAVFLPHKPRRQTRRTHVKAI
jgi:dTDP-D-glucose 4,6-dehydratase